MSDDPDVHVPYGEREEWSDIIPIPQDDGPEPLVAIQYSDAWTDTMDYFRAIVQKQEKSARALELTTAAIRMNPANYTVWYYRRLCLDALGADWAPELAYTRRHALMTPKNYQIWYHRRQVLERLGDASEELAFTAEALASDAKNYHAWSHRQWVLTMYGGWEGELDFVDVLLHRDIRNNSAWNQRWFTLRSTGKFDDRATRVREVEYTLGKLREVPHNESAWNYLRGLLSGPVLQPAEEPRVAECVEEIKARTPRNPYVWAFYLDVLLPGLPVESEAQRTAQQLQVCRMLETQVDPIRAAYWRYRAQSIKRAAKAGAAVTLDPPPASAAASTEEAAAVATST
jgi:protein farnesyltransferase/geranylgeranyltransferase type-1 subunit alpha